MIELPDFKDAYAYENAFYLTCKPERLGKLIAHYELYKLAMQVPGSIVEAGIFKGPSFNRFAAFRYLFEASGCRDLIGFDTFGKFPDTAFEQDRIMLKKFIDNAGDESISMDQLTKVLVDKDCGSGVTLVGGDILETVPEFVKQHPELRISLLHLDVDIYEPSKCVIECFYPLMSPGSVLILDDYTIFPGATKAVDDYFEDRPEKVQRFPFCFAPHYIIKQ
jgi:hypothetical protein